MSDFPAKIRFWRKTVRSVDTSVAQWNAGLNVCTCSVCERKCLRSQRVQNQLHFMLCVQCRSCCAGTQYSEGMYRPVRSSVERCSCRVTKWMLARSTIARCQFNCQLTFASIGGYFLLYSSLELHIHIHKYIYGIFIYLFARHCAGRILTCTRPLRVRWTVEPLM